MSFRKFGGLNYAKSNNIVHNHISNTDVLGIADHIGATGSQITCESELIVLDDITSENLTVNNRIRTEYISGPTGVGELGVLKLDSELQTSRNIVFEPRTAFEPQVALIFSDGTSQYTSITSPSSYWQPIGDVNNPDAIFYTKPVIIGVNPTSVALAAQVNLAVNGTVGVLGDLYVGKIVGATFQPQFFVTDDGNMGVTGTVNLYNTLSVTGGATFASNLTLSGILTLNNTASGSRQINNTFYNLNDTGAVASGTYRGRIYSDSASCYLELQTSGQNFTNTIGGTNVFQTTSTNFQINVPLQITTNFGATGTNSFTIRDSVTSNRLGFLPNSGVGSHNDIVASGDQVIYATGTQNSENLTLTTWSTTNCGLRISPNAILLGAGWTGSSPSTRMDINGATNTLTLTTSNVTALSIDSSGNSTFSNNMNLTGGNPFIIYGPNTSTSPSLRFVTDNVASYIQSGTGETANSTSNMNFTGIYGSPVYATIGMSGVTISNGSLNFGSASTPTITSSNTSTDLTISSGSGRSIILRPSNTTIAITATTSLITFGVATTSNTTMQALSFNATSDYRIKENIQQINANVDALNPVQYYNTLSKRQDFGLIAHEVQEHFPTLVHGEKDGIENQSINYTGLIAILISEIQELKKKVKELMNKEK